MAMVDFSNAVLTPEGSSIISSYSYVNLNQGDFSNLTTPGIAINSNANVTIIKNEANQAIISYTGTFTESGNGFYIGLNNYYPRWKITGISFQAGDTYSFQIPITLICN